MDWGFFFSLDHNAIFVKTDSKRRHCVSYHTWLVTAFLLSNHLLLVIPALPLKSLTFTSGYAVHLAFSYGNASKSMNMFTCVISIAFHSKMYHIEDKFTAFCSSVCSDWMHSSTSLRPGEESVYDSNLYCQDSRSVIRAWLCVCVSVLVSMK